MGSQKDLELQGKKAKLALCRNKIKELALKLTNSYFSISESGMTSCDCVCPFNICSF